VAESPLLDKQETNAQAGSRYLESQPDILRCLKRLRDERADLTLRIDRSSDHFRAKVLDVTDSEFLVEDITPREGIKMLQVGTTFSVSARARGLFAFIEDVRITQVDAERGLPFFHVNLPDRILCQQRRVAARYRLPLRVSADGATVTLFRDTPMTGNLIDLSVGGCRAEFDAGPEMPFQNDEEVDVCAITISDFFELHGKAAIRHASYNKAKHKLVVGIELTEMHVTDRRRLEQFIQSIAKTANEA
jgi:c-di-GMP-binding flagellar brake protein YcgR